MADDVKNFQQRHSPISGLTPVMVANRLRHLPDLVFFDSAGYPNKATSSPISVIAARPSNIFRGSIHSQVDQKILRQSLAESAVKPCASGFPPGGLCGWIDYEGDFVFGEYPEMLVYDHAEDAWWEIGFLAEFLSEIIDAPVSIGPFTATTRHQDFLDRVERIKEWIAAGDIYQVNLSQTFEAVVRGGSLFNLYQKLREASPAPMAAWLSLGGKEVLSSSPESFLNIRGRQIETRPIKGTRPRFLDPSEDRRSAYELQTSSKEIAELVMITDLLRNDLGQVCEFGSVEVSEMLRLESLAQVHHLVSTITGTLRTGTDAINALAACFPGGSITGAPKLRAMEIIHELEKQARGIYCGAIGWLGFDGSCSFNIAIRTMVRHNEQLTYQVGAGIVADSDPQKEYEETLHKAAGIRLALERCDRIMNE